jgi:predicted nuclease of predicted toxin-antitoxin system
MKILIDMNMTHLWVQFLLGHGFEAVHWSMIGSPSAPDTEIFDYAAANGCCVLTHDLDFGMLLARRRTKFPSVLQVRTMDVLPEGPCGGIVLRSLSAARLQIEEGALVSVSPEQHRIRLLPI